MFLSMNSSRALSSLASHAGIRLCRKANVFDDTINSEGASNTCCLEILDFSLWRTYVINETGRGAGAAVTQPNNFMNMEGSTLSKTRFFFEEGVKISREKINQLKRLTDCIGAINSLTM